MCTFGEKIKQLLGKMENKQYPSGQYGEEVCGENVIMKKYCSTMKLNGLKKPSQ